jgi:O-antigen/teichoic acid export membrane protein
MWAVTDQVFSSGTNFVPSLLLARLLGPAGYGTFSVAFLAWFLTLSVIGSAFMQSYTIAASSLVPSEWRELTSRASGLVVTAGVVAGAIFAVAGLVVGTSSELGRALLAVAVLAPGLALQEFWRVASFASRRAKTAAANDFYWAVGQTVVFAAVLLTTRITAAESILAWGAGAWVAAALGMVQLSVKPRIGRVTLELARQWLSIGAWFTGALSLYSAGMFGVAAIVAVEAGDHALGLFRMVQGNLFGPVQLVLIATSSVFLPHLVRSIRSASATAVNSTLLYSAATAVTVAGYGGALLLVAPFILSRVFGSAFSPAAMLVLPMLVAFTIDAAGNGAVLMLQAQRRGRGLVAMQLVGTSARILAVILLIGPYGVLGAAWGLAIGSSVTTILAWALVLGKASSTIREGAAPSLGREARSDRSVSVRQKATEDGQETAGSDVDVGVQKSAEEQSSSAGHTSTEPDTTSHTASGTQRSDGIFSGRLHRTDRRRALWRRE